MDHQRKNRSDKYHQKKHNHEKYDKIDKHNLNEEQQNLIENISNMSPSQLLKFMENKFDKLVNSNEKLFPKICKAVQKRSNSFFKLFEQGEKERLKKFVEKHTGKQLSEQGQKQILQSGKFGGFKLAQNQLIQVSFVNSKCTRDTHRRIFSAKVSIFEPKQQVPRIFERFYLKGVEITEINVVDFKRFKKESEEFLENYLSEMNFINQALAQQ